MTNGNDPINDGPTGELVKEGWSAGLTKREWLAGMAMQGLLHKCEHDKPVSVIVDQAVYFADALLAELGKEKK